ncbi:MAG: acyl-CoA synthetase FdrA, partial [Methyloligellaceae bacterium]
VVRGLYSGGTLAAEAQLIFLRHQCAVSSNVPVPGASALKQADGHAMIDLGSDEYTQGRPHPMIDPAVRDAALEAALGDAQVKVLLLDIILGFGAHGDPAGYLAQQLEKCGRNDTIIVASVCGGDDDFQGRDRQIDKLKRADVVVAPSNADAAELAFTLIRDSSHKD